MNEDAQKLLMMFIRDGYKSRSGKISRGTALKMMDFVRNNPELKRAINRERDLLKFRLVEVKSEQS